MKSFGEFKKSFVHLEKLFSEFEAVVVKKAGY